MAYALIMLRLRLPFLALLAALCAPAFAQANVKALMLSDIHFDPFRYPEQFAALNSSPAADWPKILSTPLTNPTQPEPCPSRGFDTDWTLFQSSLKAEQTALAKPAFITISGDLMGHEFDCRYKAMAGKGDTPEAYSTFASKTLAFVIAQVHAAFPTTPVYFALGNNDSGCGDYFEDFGSAFLQETQRAMNSVLPSSKHRSVESFPEIGAARMSLPVPNTEMIALQNIFESAGYKNCARKPDPEASVKQMAWLRKHLEAARATHKRVWLMAHIPTGVNVYSTIRAKANICTGDAAAPFLNNSALADIIAEFPDVIRLSIFAHTHNDEIHLFTSGDGKRFVPAKIVPSISPINGNHPSFTLAEVNTKTATLADYTVVTASNLTGVDATWTESYRFTKTYGEPDFSASSVADLAHKLTADHTGQAADSLLYEKLWFPGDTGIHAAASMLMWPLYSCSITADHAADYKSCVCPATTPPAEKPAGKPEAASH